jgi:hypothetical protein
VHIILQHPQWRFSFFLVPCWLHVPHGPLLPWTASVRVGLKLIKLTCRGRRRRSRSEGVLFRVHGIPCSKSLFEPTFSFFFFFFFISDRHGPTEIPALAYCMVSPHSDALAPMRNGGTQGGTWKIRITDAICCIRAGDWTQPGRT